MTRAWVGTSGFSYKEWKGAFYPQGLADSRLLAFYSTRFGSVEIDSSFYRMPTPATLQKWAQSVGPDFRFVLKAPQQITHRERLALPSESSSRLIDVVPELGSRLGLVCFQLPPFFRCDVERLEAFLAHLADRIPCALEFRHPSWFVPEVYRVLRTRRAALCIHDADDGCTPREITSSAVYVRLRRARYAADEVERWRAEIRGWSQAGLEVYAYIKHKDNPQAPHIALSFAEGLSGPSPREA